MNVNISSNFPANSTTTDSDAISHEALIKTFAILSINVVWLLDALLRQFPHLSNSCEN